MFTRLLFDFAKYINRRPLRLAQRLRAQDGVHPSYVELNGWTVPKTLETIEEKDAKGIARGICHSVFLCGAMNGAIYRIWADHAGSKFTFVSVQLTGVLSAGCWIVDRGLQNVMIKLWKVDNLFATSTFGVVGVILVQPFYFQYSPRQAFFQNTLNLSIVISKHFFTKPYSLLGITNKRLYNILCFRFRSWN